VRVRSVQVHDRPVASADAGQRVAVNLPGVERSRLARGQALVQAGEFSVTYRLDVALQELEEIPPAVTVHIGTADVPARLVRASRFAQLRLRRPVVAARGGRVVLRTQTTVGGGFVLDPAPPRHFDPERLERIERGELASTIHAPVRIESVRYLLDGEPEGVERAGEWLFSPAWLDELQRDVARRLDAADPLDPGIAPLQSPWAE